MYSNAFIYKEVKKVKNKKQTKIVILVVVIVVAVLGTIGVKKMNEPTGKENQIAFLKAHEEEMTEYVKSQNSKIVTVQYDWDSVDEVIVGNGLPKGAGRKIQILGFVNNHSNLDFRMDVSVDKNSIPIMSTLHFGQSINL